jgi:transposase-like protein
MLMAVRWYLRYPLRTRTFPNSWPVYPAAVEALKAEGMLPRRDRLRKCQDLNNIIEQDHGALKKRGRPDW